MYPGMIHPGIPYKQWLSQYYPGMYTYTYPSVRVFRDSLVTGLGLGLGLHSMSPRRHCTLALVFTKQAILYLQCCDTQGISG